MTEDATAAGNIVEVAQGDETFSTLVAAVTAAELGETLSGPGPFTVFAPTNDAFGKLPEGTVEETDHRGILKPSSRSSPTTWSKERLTRKTLTTAITEAGEGGYTVTTVGGGNLTATIADGGVVLTDATGNMARVTDTDVEASNGLIHVIDTVLMPQ